MLSAFRRFEQRGGNPLFRAEFTSAGRNCSFRGIVEQKKFRLTLEQLREPNEEPLGKAITEAIMQGLRRVVENEGLNVQEYSLRVAVHSNSISHVRSQSARNIPLQDWLSNGTYTRARVEELFRQLNSAEVIDPHRDGFYVELTFVKQVGRGGTNEGRKGNPGRQAWEKLAKKKRCVVTIKNKDDLCYARAIVTMKEKADKGSHFNNIIAAIAIKGIAPKMPVTIIVRDRIALPAAAPIRPAPILPRGSSRPLNALNVIVYLWSRLFYSPSPEIQRKEEKWQKRMWTLAQVFEMLRRISIGSKEKNTIVTTPRAQIAGNLLMWIIVAIFNRCKRKKTPPKKKH